MNRRQLIAAAAGLPLLGAAKVRPRILVLGDSVTWGQGLREGDKMHSLLSRKMFARDSIEPSTHLYAVSGALIGEATPPRPVEPWWPREVPRDDPTLHDQCALVAADHPDRHFDIIVVAGGINDVNVRKIFSPTTQTAEIEALCNTYCRDRMGRLLDRIGTDFVSANGDVKVLVLGYYSVLSPASKPTALKKVVEALARETVSPPSLLQARAAGSAEDRLRIRLVENSTAFRDASRSALMAAVARANRRSPNFHFIDPAIADDEAAYGPTPLIFGLDAEAQAEDELKADRIKYCGRLLKKAAGIERFTCDRASVGHPNKPGALRYAEKMFAVV